MEDGTIIRLFWERSQDALALLDKKYGRLLRHIARNILPDGRDAEEAVSDAYLHLWNSIPPNRPEQLLAYAAKCSRNAALNILQSQRRKKRDGRSDVLFSELDECLPVCTGSGGS